MSQTIGHYLRSLLLLSTLLLLPATVVNASDDSNTKKSQSVDLTGNWRSSNGGSVFTVVDNGKEVFVWLKSSRKIVRLEGLWLWDDGRLESSYWQGIVQVDPQKKRRTSRFQADIIDDNHLRVRFDYFRWDSRGRYRGKSFTGRATWTRISRPAQNQFAAGNRERREVSVAKIVAALASNWAANELKDKNHPILAFFMRGGRDAIIESALVDSFPELNDQEINSIRIVISLYADGKLSLDRYGEALAKEEIKTKIKEQHPEHSVSIEVVDFVYEIHKAAKNKK